MRWLVAFLTSAGAARTRRMMLALASVLLVTACTATSLASAEPEPPARISVVPADDTKQWRPEKPVKLTADGGRLARVSLRTAGGEEVDGQFGDQHATWSSRRPLETGTTYRIRSVAVNPEGRRTTKTTTFRTLEPESTVRIDSVNANKGTYGVGLPIVIQFTEPIENKKRVEQAMELRTSEPVTGAWYWMNDEEVHFRPEDYWPAGMKVHLIAHMNGLRTGPEMYGDDDLWVKFDIGDKHVTRVDTGAHTMTVKSGGKVVKTIPVSAGDAEHPSSSGTFAVPSIQQHVVMNSSSYGVPVDSAGGYSLDSYWNVRYTFSGQFVHGAPWSVAAQGDRNVSHGCINASTAKAKWFYRFTNVGDIVKVTGTGREVQWGNGWTDWEKSFEEYVQGSATGEPVYTLTMDGEPRTRESERVPSPA